MELKDYIKSSEWRKKRIETFLIKWKKCMKCGSEKQIHVHHSTYNRLWNECIETDLFPLCKRCHNFFHKKYEWHFIKNTLEFISIKEIPKNDTTQIVKHKNVLQKKKKIKNKKRKVKNKIPKKTKVSIPHKWLVYYWTQWKKYKFNSWKPLFHP